MGTCISRPPEDVPVFPFKGHSGVAWVSNVIDGDTVDLKLQIAPKSWIQCRARLFGIDAAEKREVGGPAATEHLRQLLADGKVRIEIHPKQTDKYGRLLVILYRKKNCINDAMCEYRHPTLGQVCWPYDGGKKPVRGV